MSKIWVLLTWWTPSAKETNTGRVSDSWAAFKDECIRILDHKAGVDIYEVFNLDSSDFRGEQHEQLALKIEEVIQRNRQYIGIVIIHGTDTNAWTLASHSYMIKGLWIPMIHTWSILPNEDPRSDFPRNFSWALDGIFENEILWVYQYFWDHLLPWVKVTKQYTDTYKPFVDPHSRMSYGILDSQWVFRVDPYFRDAINQAHRETSQVLDIDTRIEKNIEQVVLHPFMDYSIFDYYRELWKKWIFIQGYGDANVPTSTDFQDAIKRCIESGIIILLWSQCIHWERHANYEGGKKLLDTWAILMRHHTNEAALCKLAWALKKYEWDSWKIRSAIERDVNGDLVIM